MTIQIKAIDAMTQTIRIWLELAENGEDVEWKRKMYKQYEHGCPLCQYVIGSGSIPMQVCNECPMYGHWGSSWNSMCDTPGASYYAWRNEDDPDERKAKAREIVNEMIKVRAEMIASLEEKKEETMSDIVELNIKRTVTSKLRFKLDNDSGDVRLVVVDEKGERLSGGTILRIKPNGKLWRATSIYDGFGLQLDGDGRIVIE